MNTSSKIGLSIITLLFFVIVSNIFYYGFGDTNQENKAIKQGVNIQNAQEATLEAINDTEKKAEEKTTELQVEKVEQSKPTLFKVSKVVDGDTLAVEINGQEETLRLIGINTPETVDPRKPVECFGKEASNKAKEILSDKVVKLEEDPTQGNTDKYNRLLRYVYLEDGTNFNKLMIEEGYAYEYTYNTPYKYQSDFKLAQQKAEKEKRGLWADDACAGKLTKDIEVKAEETVVKAVPTPAVTAPISTGSSGAYSCNCSKTCPQMGCAEAQYQLNTCGCSRRDADHDGVACDTDCQ